MPAFLPLETDRLTLRLLVADDLDALYDMLSRPDVARYQYWDEMDRDAVAEKLADWVTLDGEAGRHLELGIVERASGKLVGHIILAFRNIEARQGEIGYTLHPDVHGRGYATEAARAVMALGFSYYNLHRIFAATDVRNAASYKVMEKLGMRREAHFREHAIFKGGWDEEYHYAILEDEWRAQQKANA